MSSHREAPEISKDPAADNADVYAFVSPDSPGTVTLISNFVPLQDPPGGPNFFEFGDDVLYSIYIDNDGDGKPEISYVFRFSSRLRNPNTFLYNTGPITSLNSPNWNKRQFYSVTRVEGSDTTAYGTATNGNGKHHHAPKLKTRVLGRDLACPPCNIGPRSTPNYPALGQAAVHNLGGGVKVFAGQRQDGFYVDLGSTFDLADLRPFQNLHLIPTPAAPGVDATATLNIHSIALQVPISHLTRNGSVPKDAGSSASVIGVWSAASRRKVRMIDKANDEKAQSGPWVQVSRLGNPLINEVVIPLGLKDKWNTLYPVDDKAFASHYEHPELAGLLPVLYPGVFPNLAALKAARADLVAVLLTGIPSGIVPGFQNFTGKVMADQLRLNVAIPPTTSNPSIFGLLGGDAAGFPNGRRVFDDTVSIELRAIAGVTYALVNKSFTPDGAAGKLTEGLTPASNRYQATFPYLGPPLDGFDTPSAPTST
ncbi:MAG TPA: DUF4331 domain-containing protein [Solirubrobacteraceae bacterium]|nr:DUF4331 domain-containing protein [Solirubrobacteraceae bacterium]